MTSRRHLDWTADANPDALVTSPRRLEWTQIPDAFRRQIESCLGAAVVEAENQSGGFSPGLAARVRLADGRRCFIKAVSREHNARALELYHAEATVAAALPDPVHAPRLRHVVDDEPWFALIFDEAPGVMPATPWRADQLARVLGALTDLARRLTPCPLPDARRAADVLERGLTAYRRLCDDPPEDLGDWERQRLPDLADLADRSLAAIDGDTLLHLDLRADNMLIDGGGGVTFVDWPWASRGAQWVDLVGFGVDIERSGHDPETLLDGHPLLAGVDPDDVNAFLAGLAGMWARSSRKPPEPGLPTLRTFQRQEHDATLSWLRRRIAW